jgi:hypothetical protein
VVFAAPAGIKARIKLVGLGADGSVLPSQEQGNEALLNGGTILPYRPVALRAERTHEGDRISVVLYGVDLDRVTGASFVGDGGPYRFTLNVTQRSEISLSAEASIPYPLPRGRIQLSDDRGIASAIEIPGDPGHQRSFAPSDVVLVRFRRGQVEPRAGTDGGTVAEFAITSPQLRSRLPEWGVTRLERLFPWFRHEDVHSTNSLGERVELEDLADFYLAYLAPSADASAAVGSMADAPEVLHASLDYGGPAATFTPNDPDYVKQWGLKNSGQVLCGWQAQADDIRAELAWDITTGSPAVRVAVLDTGIDTTHVELAGRARGGPVFVPGAFTSFDDDSVQHGTAVTAWAGALFHGR